VKLGLFLKQRSGGLVLCPVVLGSALGVISSASSRQRYVARGHIKGKEMRPDYDLSGLEPFQADLWVFFQADAIRTEILHDQANRQGFKWCAGTDLKELRGFFTESVSAAELPKSAGLICPYTVSLWVH
jgi:hypothetical protein